MEQTPCHHALALLLQSDCVRHPAIWHTSRPFGSGAYGFRSSACGDRPYVSHQRLDLLKASGCSGSVVGLTITGWLFSTPPPSVQLARTDRRMREKGAMAPSTVTVTAAVPSSSTQPKGRLRFRSVDAGQTCNPPPTPCKCREMGQPSAPLYDGHWRARLGPHASVHKRRRPGFQAPRKTWPCWSILSRLRLIPHSLSL